MQRYFNAFKAIAGALPWALAYPLYLAGLTASQQVGAPRMAGLLAAFGGLFLGIAACLAALAVSLNLDQRNGLRQALERLIFALLVANTAAIGFHMYLPTFDPTQLKVGLALASALLVLRFLFIGEAGRRTITGLLLSLGHGALALSLLVAPWALLEARGERHAWRPEPGEASSVRDDAPSRIVLITFDALRARSTSLQRPNSGQTPHLLALARESTVYTGLRAASDATLESMPAILSGVPPGDVSPHLRTRPGYLRQGALAGLARHLAPAGYRAYFSTSLITPRLLGMAAEYEHGYSNAFVFTHDNLFDGRSFVPWRESLGLLARPGYWKGPVSHHEEMTPHSTRRVFDEATHLLEATRGRQFLWVHVGSPHAPYLDMRPGAGADDYRPGPGAPIPHHHVYLADEATLRDYEARYEAYVRYADHELGRFLAHLRADARWADTLLIATGDHGEEFVKGRHPHNSGYLSEDVTHVPLLIHRPGQARAERDDTLVAHIDLAPTILSTVFRRLPTGLSGMSLFEPRPTDRTVTSWGLFSRFFRRNSPQQSVAVYRNRHKYVLELVPRREALYDLATDPRAQRDRSSSLRPTLLALRQQAERELQRPAGRRP